MREAGRGVLIGALWEGLVEMVLHVGLGDTAGDKAFDLSKEGGGSICLEVVCLDGGEELGNFLGSREVGDFSC